MTPEDRQMLWADLKPIVQLLAPLALLFVVLLFNIIWHYSSVTPVQPIRLAPTTIVLP